MINIFGVGGHAKVVIDAALRSGLQIVSVYDDNTETHGKEFCGFRVAGSVSPEIRGKSIIAIGSNDIRKRIHKKLVNTEWHSIIHPTAIIAHDVSIGLGTVIMAGAIIQPGSIIGNHCIINTGACIDHDCHISDYVHIAPNASIAGGVSIGEGSFIGIGSVITQYKSIGSWSILGAGSAVIKDIPNNCTAVGTPAKVIKKHS